MGLLLVTLGLIVTFGAAGPSSAVPITEAPVTFFLDPSVRAAGAGRASTAVWWGGDPDYWANPALLGYHHGIRFETARRRLVPDLAHGFYFRTDRWTFGLWGIGMAAAGKPPDLGGCRLDYEPSTAVDEQGHELGRFDSWETMQYRAIGLSTAELATHLLWLVDRHGPDLRRYGDIALGRAFKDADVFLLPAWVGSFEEDITARASTRDEGILFRVTPINSLRDSGESAGHRCGASRGGVRLDVSFAKATQNKKDAYLVYPALGEAYRVARVRRTGWGMRASLGSSPWVHQTLVGWDLACLEPSLQPMLSLGLAVDRSQANTRFLGRQEVSKERSTTAWGVEVSAGRILTLRGGRIDDPDGDIIGYTYGVGLGIEIGKAGGFRWDFADIPQAQELDRVHRNSLSLFFDPLETFSLLRGVDW
jgi:hypothetical protein